MPHKSWRGGKKKKKISHTYLLQRFVVVLLGQEVDVSRSDDAHQFAAHFARLRDGNAGEAVSCFGFNHVPDCVARTHHDWVCDESLFEPLKTKKNKQINYSLPLLFKKKKKKSFNPNGTQQN